MSYKSRCVGPQAKRLSFLKIRHLPLMLRVKISPFILNISKRISRSYVTHITHKPMFFRVSGLPNAPSARVSAYLAATVKQQYSNNESLNVFDIVTLPSCYGHQPSSSVALLRFENGIPEFLTDLVADPLDSLHIRAPDFDTRPTSITIDRHFHGFTQLYHTDPAREVAAE